MVRLVLAAAALSACEPIVYEPAAPGDGGRTGDEPPPGVGVCVDVNGVRPATRGCEDGCDIADFGEVLTSRSHTKAIIVTNCAPQPLTLRGLFWAPASSNAFTLLEPRRDRTFEPLQEGASLTVRVRFQPSHTNGDHGALVLLTDRTDQPRLVIGVRGNSDCETALACTPGPFLSARAPRAFGAATCTAFGSEPVTIANVSLAGDPPLSLRGTATNGTLSPGDSVRVRFTCEGATGIHTATATVFSDACSPELEIDARCDAPPAPPACSAGPYSATEVWRWEELSTGSNVDDVVAMPVVARISDGNENGVPDANDPTSVVFTAFPATAGFDLCNANDPEPGILVAADGATGQIQWTWGQLPLSLADPVTTVQADSQLATGDVDGDGWPEIVAVRFRYRGPAPGCAPTDILCCLSGKYATGTLLLIEHDGDLAWESERWNLSDDTLANGGAPALADVDGDGFAEIAFGNTLFDRFGRVRFEGGGGEGDAGDGPFAAFCDLDGDGAPELVAGNTVLRADGSVLWARDDLDDGVVACANTHGDEQLEVILFEVGDDLSVLAPGDGATLAGPVQIDNTEGESFAAQAPAVGDIDGDGQAEIVVSAGDLLFLFEHDLTEVWRLARSSTVPSGIALFDVNGDGALEILDPDSGGVDVIDASQAVLITFSGSSSSNGGYPVVVDLDLDGHAEILVTDDDPLGFGADHGVAMIRPAANDLPATLSIWSQHAYFDGVTSELGEVWPAAPDGPFHANPAFCTP